MVIIVIIFDMIKHAGGLPMKDELEYNIPM